jgi:hypothetical protein
MSKAEGIYLSADFRVTEYPSGRLIDDASVKMLTIHYPPDKVGARAVLAYTGLAILPDGTPTGKWIRETLRGESEVPDQSMAHLRDRMNRDLAPRRFPLIINALIVQGERRFFGGLSNLRADPRMPSRTQVLREFEYVMTELTQPFCFVNGSAATRVIGDKHLDLIRAQLDVRPRKAFNHMKLLASINRRVAAKEATVSPACHVAFLPSKVPIGSEDPGLGPHFLPTSHSFTERGESAPAVMPMLLFGIDLSELMRFGMEQFRAMEAGEEAKPLDKDAMNESLKRRR